MTPEPLAGKLARASLAPAMQRPAVTSQPGLPPLTVFTSTVYPDVARIWYACVRRAFPAGVRFEIFYDSEAGDLAAEDFPGAVILKRNATRREFHDAYNDAVRRAVTPYLAIVDSDVYWVSEQLWPQVEAELKRPEVAAVSCISRSRRPSHGTYSVVLKPEIYRAALERLPAGFYPAAEYLDAKIPMSQWRWFDTGDVLTQAVRDGGHEVIFHHLDKGGGIVRFYGITLSRRGGENLGEKWLAWVAGRDRYFWRGYACNLVLRRLYGRLFPESPAYGFSFRALPLAWRSLMAGLRMQLWRLRFIRQIWASAHKVEAFVTSAAPK